MKGAKVVVDPDSLMILRGSILDYENTIESEGIHVAFNPNARHSCGCKTSFSLIPGFEFKK
jgi:iron-sulfur cluster assembly accessory protein